MIFTRQRSIVLASALGLTGAAPAGSPPCGYTVETYQAPICGFPFDDYPPTVPVAITPGGLIVGYYWQCAVPTRNEGFIVTPEGLFQTLPRPAGVVGLTCADGNDSGVVVGTALFANPSAERGFMRIGDSYTFLEGSPEFCHLTSAVAVNASGMVAANRRALPCLSNHHRACLWTVGEVVDIPPVHGPRSVAEDIDDQGRIVGWMGTSPSVDGQAFLWEDGVTQLLPIPSGWISARATAVVDVDGEAIVVGILYKPHPQGLFFVSAGAVWLGKSVIEIAPLPGFDRVNVQDVAPGPLVLGWSHVSTSGAAAPFVWSDGVTTVLEPLITEGALQSISTVHALNSKGQIAVAGNSLRFDITAAILSPTIVSGDLTGDCIVDGADLGVLLSAWGSSEPEPDVNSDGVVDAADLAALLSEWSGR